MTAPLLKPDSPQRYGTVSRVLHWGMALGFAWMFATTLTTYFFAESALDELLWPTHKSVGALMMLLLLVRGAWSLLNARRRPASTSLLAHLGHLALYAVMFAVPFIGLLRQFGSGRAFAPFGIPLMPGFEGGAIKWMTDLGGNFHGLLGWTLLALTVGHIAAALWHRRSSETNVIPRMFG
ncbi:MAG: cytochrome b [Pseudomonas sp.]|uniref:cytochrome b n=1 Tax=Pseudomonas sp. TaxID=306 RepID=UPI003D0AB798